MAGKKYWRKLDRIRNLLNDFGVEVEEDENLDDETVDKIFGFVIRAENDLLNLQTGLKNKGI